MWLRKSKCARAASAVPPTRFRSRFAPSAAGSGHSLADAAARNRNENTMRERLAGRAHGCRQQPRLAVKKREDTHKMAEANRAFSHYRW
jgi:hypothetical protein